MREAPRGSLAPERASSEQADALWKVHILPPSPRLACDVLFYVARRRRRAGEPVTVPPWQTRFPANMYSALTVVHSGQLLDSATGSRTPGIALSGAMSRAALRDYIDGPQTTVVVFKPGRMTDFCRLPAYDLSDTWADAGAVLGVGEHNELCDGLAEQTTVARQIMVLDRLLERRLHGALHTPASQIARAMHGFIWQLPHAKVGDLVSRFGWTARRLERRFRDHFGVSPQTMIRLARLQLALLKLQRRDPGCQPGVHGVAQEAGYADHAHMAREFKSLVGLTATQVHRALRAPGNSMWAFAAPQDSLLALE